MNDSDFTDAADPTPLTLSIVIKRVNGQVVTNVPHLVIEHSPTGFEFGYGGSGPADLALNLAEVMLKRMNYAGSRMSCFDNTSCFIAAWQLHQGLKRDLIAGIGDEGIEIPYPVMVEYITQKLAEAEARNA